MMDMINIFQEWKSIAPIPHQFQENLGRAPFIMYQFSYEEITEIISHLYM